MYDVVGVHNIALHEGLASVELKAGDTCKGSFQGNLFDARIIAKGTED